MAWISSAFFLCLVFSLSLALAEEPSSVITLDGSNFSDTVAKHPFIVVKFYAPWCKRCKKLAPEYEKAALILSKNDPPVVLAKVDTDAELNKDLGSEYKLRGIPTLMIVRNGGEIINEYKGPLDADGIVEYLKKQLGPPSTEFKSLKDFTDRIDNKGIFILGVFPEFSGREFENFLTVADKRRTDFDFAHILEAEFARHEESAVVPPLVKLFKPFDEPFIDFQDFHVDALENFIESASVPLVTTYDDEPSNQPYIEKFFKNPDDKAMLFLKFSNENIDAFKSKYHETAEHYKAKNISFLIGDHDGSQGGLLQHFGVKEDQLPLILIQQKDGKKYLIPNVKPDQIATSLKEYTDGSLNQFIKSEPIPEVNNEPVKIVVADNIHEVVFNSGKNVLLEFHVASCEYCKKLAPTIESVAASFEKDADVIIAKMDAIANDIPQNFEVEGVPTLYLYSASGKPVLYEGDRTREDIINFIQINRDARVAPDTIKDDQPDTIKDEL